MFGAGVMIRFVLFSLLGEQAAAAAAAAAAAGVQIPINGGEPQQHIHTALEGHGEPAIALAPASSSASNAATAASARKLHGRFLQVTDFHPDSFYEVYSSTAEDAACHRGQGPAGYYGAETSECDSPFSLVNATFDWIKAEVKDSIDFVIWTGDSARHDNDEENPRNVNQVVGLNEYMVQKFVEVFGKPDNDQDDDPTNDLVVPVIPTFGNNDILPHNIFERGPNRWTKTYLGIWKKFIPEAQRHQFDQGGWFNVEVIPGHLSVFSLNSLYFFDSNSAVDGCAAKSEPGYRQLEWMRIQLQYLRSRNMKAIIIGHVPPARTSGKQSWDETCWQKYTLWMRQYRDVIVGSMYGHMNTDHFMLQDFKDIDQDVSDGYESTRTKRDYLSLNDDSFDAQVSANYLIELREAWSKLPRPPTKKAMAKYEALQSSIDLDETTRSIGDSAEMFRSISHSSDDGRPDWEIDALLYPEQDRLHADRGKKKKHNKNGDKKKKRKKHHNPRDYIDEIGGVFAERFSASFASPSVVPNYFPTIRIYEYNITGLYSQVLGPHGSTVETFLEWQELPESQQYLDPISEDDAQIARKKKKPKKRRFNLPLPPSSAAPPGPAYSPQSLSLLGFTQYYANLTRINNDFDASGKAQPVEPQGWKEGKHHGQKPHDKDHEPRPKKFVYEVLYDTRNDTVYNLTDLTMRGFLDLAQRIGNFKSDKHGSSLAASEDEAEEGDVSEDDFSGEEDDEDDKDEYSHAAKKDKKKKHKKKKHRKHHTKKRNRPWLTFIRRAFVDTMDEAEIEENFGH